MQLIHRHCWMTSDGRLKCWKTSVGWQAIPSPHMPHSQDLLDAMTMNGPTPPFRTRQAGWDYAYKQAVLHDVQPPSDRWRRPGAEWLISHQWGTWQARRQHSGWLITWSHGYPQRRTQFETDFTELITPTLREAREILQDWESDLEDPTGPSMTQLTIDDSIEAAWAMRIQYGTDWLDQATGMDDS